MLAVIRKFRNTETMGHPWCASLRGVGGTFELRLLGVPRIPLAVSHGFLSGRRTLRLGSANSFPFRANKVPSFRLSDLCITTLQNYLSKFPCRHGIEPRLSPDLGQRAGIEPACPCCPFGRISSRLSGLSPVYRRLRANVRPLHETRTRTVGIWLLVCPFGQN